MLNAVFVTMAVLTLSPAPPSTSPAPSLRTTAPSHASASARVAAPARTAETGAAAAQATLTLPGGVADPNSLYSIRARKRFAAYLRLRLLELREEHLSRAAEAIERHISVSDLLKTP